MWTSSDALNSLLRGFTDVVELRLTTAPEEKAYATDLEIVLANRKRDHITLHCEDIGQLTLVKFGPGISQLILLWAEDMRHLQLDQAGLKFRDLENDKISFVCRRAQVLQS